MKTSKKGISLIVLVITIIVMIILATAIILSLSGSDIRGKADEAVSETDMSTAKEAVAVARSEWELNYDQLKDEYDGDFKAYATEKLKKAGIDYVTVSNDGAVNTIYTDKNNHKAIIPEGFTVSTAQGEQTIDNGLVIVDKKGNEFVWVPVDDMDLFKRTTTYTETITDPGDSYDEPYETSTYTEERKEYDAMYASVAENHGFYIARYEAGLPEGKTAFTVTSSDKPVSKKGATVWNNIQWGTSMTDIGTKGAVYRARQMYKASKSVVSTLCYGVQWDSALQFISTRGVADDEYAKDAMGKGNYDGDSIASAGSSEEYVFNNIYDMAGNVCEWTMEMNSGSIKRVQRGGYLLSYSSSDFGYASIRHSSGASHYCTVDGFRVALYIK